MIMLLRGTSITHYGCTGKVLDNATTHIIGDTAADVKRVIYAHAATIEGTNILRHDNVIIGKVTHNEAVFFSGMFEGGH
jgi:hypothetical protein